MLLTNVGSTAIGGCAAVTVEREMRIRNKREDISSELIEFYEICLTNEEA